MLNRHCDCNDFFVWGCISDVDLFGRVEEAKVMMRDLEMRSQMDRQGVDMMNVQHPEYCVTLGNSGISSPEMLFTSNRPNSSRKG